MVSVSFESNIDAWARYVHGSLAPQIPFATAKALTETAKRDLKPAADRLIARRFDRPTPFTRNAMAFLPARKNNLIATVFAKDIQGRYLKVQEEGGTQKPKRRAIPIAAGQKRNKYGNAPRGSLQRALARPDTFSGTVKGIPGVWQRPKRGRRRDGSFGNKGIPKLLFLYVDATHYHRRFHFKEEMVKVARNAFPAQFARALEHAIRTAR